jgi:hypothetical protein
LKSANPEKLFAGSKIKQIYEKVYSQKYNLFFVKKREILHGILVAGTL